jgi:NADH dehydrogenase
MACYLTVPLLIPVLTTFGLPVGYRGDILGGGFILSLASFLVALAALDTGSPYAQLGASRAKAFAAITEPVVLFVVFTVALVTSTDLPYALAATVRSSAGQTIRPARLLAAAALFLVTSPKPAGSRWRRTPARTSSGCASGSHVCSGTSPVLVPKPSTASTQAEVTRLAYMLAALLAMLAVVAGLH